VIFQRESAKNAFFERQLLVEILTGALGKGKATKEPSPPIGDTVTGRALRYIEANLFSAISLSAIARQAFASPATLLRHFRKNAGQTPYAYIKALRLEEARRLIQGGSHAIGDVALLVGYENFAAFTTAFTKHFGARPSSLKRRARSS
jgi:AraC-like DNA-binding protein